MRFLNVISLVPGLVLASSLCAQGTPRPLPIQVEQVNVLPAADMVSALADGRINPSGQAVFQMSQAGGSSYRLQTWNGVRWGGAVSMEPFSVFITDSGNCWGNRASVSGSSGFPGIAMQIGAGSFLPILDPQGRWLVASSRTFEYTLYRGPDAGTLEPSFDVMDARGVFRRTTLPWPVELKRPFRDDLGRTYISQADAVDPVTGAIVTPATLIYVLDVSDLQSSSVRQTTIDYPSSGLGLRDVARNGTILVAGTAAGGTPISWMRFRNQWIRLPDGFRPEGVTSTGVVVGGTSVWYNNVLTDLAPILQPSLPAGARLVFLSGVDDSGWVIGRIELTNGDPRLVTIKLNFDRDADGLLDFWELPVAQGGGIDADGDGVVDVDLHALGAGPDMRDLFVEVDSAPGVMMPFNSAELVRRAFAAAPTANPAPLGSPEGTQGPTGIRLHILRDEQINSDLMPPTAIAAPAGFSSGFPVEARSIREVHFGSQQQRQAANWNAVRPFWEQIARYCIIFPRIVKASNPTAEPYIGLAELGGNDFVLSNHAMRRVGPRADEQIAAAFMHELGHNLGLQHGGGDRINYKPNYFSIMNYLLAYRRPFSRYFYRLDYSRAGGESLSESFPNELQGFAPLASDPDAGVYAKYRMPYITDDGRLRFAPRGQAPIDFNGNGELEFFSSPRELNYFPPSAMFPDGIGEPSLPLVEESLTPQDDWQFIRYRIDFSGDFQALNLPDHSDYTPEQFDLIDAIPEPCMADLAGEGAQPGEDGVLDNNDFILYIQYFFDLNPVADFASEGAEPGSDGFFDNNDFISFIQAFFTPCNP